MTDAKHKIDWDAVRNAANDCLESTWSLVCFAKRSQDSEYDANCATAHLEAINTARDTFRSAMEVLQPGLECAADDSIRYSPVFDALALAIADRRERPNFRYGPICCATAHESAFELLRWAILCVENGLNAELDEQGLPDHYLADIDDLHVHSPGELRTTFVRLGKRESLQRLLRVSEVRQIRAWINHEWTAARILGTQSGADNGATETYLDITLGDREASRFVDGQEYEIGFDRKIKPWELFKFLIEAGEGGIHRRDLEDLVGGSIDTHKATLLRLVEELRLDIDLSNGIWTLKSM